MVGETTPRAVKAMLDEPSEDWVLRLVDIRDRRSFAEAHIPTSENLPFPELVDRIEELEGADHIVTICPHGEASLHAARLITAYEGAAETRVESLAGGLQAWSESYDLVTADGSRTSSLHSSSAPF